MARYFTLLEAEGQLPSVDRLLRRMIALRDEYQASEAGLNQVNQRLTLLGGSIPPFDESLRLRKQIQHAGSGLKEAVAAFEQIGCQLKDLETGLVDFPTLYRGKEVYLCWKFGESGIGFWHPIEDGFRGRRPIDSDFLANHTGRKPS